MGDWVDNLDSGAVSLGESISGGDWAGSAAVGSVEPSAANPFFCLAAAILSKSDAPEAVAVVCSCCLLASITGPLALWEMDFGAGVELGSMEVAGGVELAGWSEDGVVPKIPAGGAVFIPCPRDWVGASAAGDAAFFCNACSPAFDGVPEDADGSCGDAAVAKGFVLGALLAARPANPAPPPEGAPKILGLDVVAAAQPSEAILPVGPPNGFIVGEGLAFGAAVPASGGLTEFPCDGPRADACGKADDA